MNDYKILDDLFKSEYDEIHFKLFKTVKIIGINNTNRGDYDKPIQFSTRSIASNLINYANAYIELEVELEVPFKEGDSGKKGVPKQIALKNSYQLVKNLDIQLNNVVVSNEVNIDKANLVNYTLNNSNNSSTYYMNVKKTSEVSLTDNKFIIDDNYYDKKDDHTEADQQNHFIEFKIPIFLKDISDFFRKLDLQYAEFTIEITLDEELFFTTIDGISYEIKGCNLFVEEVKLTEEDKIKNLKMLKNNFVKKINFLDNHTNIYNDKLNILENNFHLNNVRNADSVFIYGIFKIRKAGKNFQLPNIQFKKAYMQIDNIKFENGITN